MNSFGKVISAQILIATVNSILSVIALNLYIGFTIPNIDNYAHIGGLIVGIIISIILTFNID